MRDYKNIKAYKLAEELVMNIYSITNKFPKEEMYGLTSQMRRAAISVPANISEGASRNHKRDYLQFLYVSRGSMAELECLMDIANRLGFLPNKEHEQISNKRSEVAKTLYGLITAVEKETKGL